MTIGEKIYKLRMSLNMTQKEFATQIGASQSAVNFWENNKRLPRMEHLFKIAEISGISVAEFAGEENTQYVGNEALRTVLKEKYFESYEKMTDLFLKLNESGQKKVRDYAADLGKIEEYSIGVEIREGEGPDGSVNFKCPDK